MAQPLKSLGAGAVLVVTLMVNGLAVAESAEEQAEGLFEEATEALEGGELARAADLYARSFEAYPAPTAAYWRANTLAKMGRLLEAAAAYRVAATWKLEPTASEAVKLAVEDARREGEALEGRIPVVAITLVGGVAKAEVFLNGRRVDAPGRHRVDPGEHVLRAEAPGRPPFAQPFRAAERDEIAIEVRFAAASPAPPDPKRAAGGATSPTDDGTEGGGAQRVAGYVIGAFGLAGLATWGATGIVFLQQKSEAEEAGCDFGGRTCPTEEGLGKVRDAQLIGTVNTAMLFTGLGLGALGLTLILTAPDDDRAITALSIVPLPGGGVSSIVVQF